MKTGFFDFVRAAFVLLMAFVCCRHVFLGMGGVSTAISALGDGLFSLFVLLVVVVMLFRYRAISDIQIGMLVRIRICLGLAILIALVGVIAPFVHFLSLK
jgi:hypothetical protein